MITGKREGEKCTGSKVTVERDGMAQIHLPGNGEDLHLAIHVGKEVRM